MFRSSMSSLPDRFSLTVGFRFRGATASQLCLVLHTLAVIFGASNGEGVTVLLHVGVEGSKEIVFSLILLSIDQWWRHRTWRL